MDWNNDGHTSLGEDLFTGFLIREALKSANEKYQSSGGGDGGSGCRGCLSTTLKIITLVFVITIFFEGCSRLLS